MAKRKRVSKKNSPKSSKGMPVKNLERRLERSNKSLLYSFIVFVVSLVFYLVTTDFLESVFGLILIISGALVILFGVVSLIIYFLKRR